MQGLYYFSTNRWIKNKPDLPKSLLIWQQFSEQYVYRCILNVTDCSSHDGDQLKSEAHSPPPHSARHHPTGLTPCRQFNYTFLKDAHNPRVNYSGRQRLIFDVPRSTRVAQRSRHMGQVLFGITSLIKLSARYTATLSFISLCNFNIMNSTQNS